MTKICQCGKTYKAKSADIKRGWGMSCSKSCAAIKRTKREYRGDFSISLASKKYQKDYSKEYDMSDFLGGNA